jgi:hypothetical protein
MTAAQNKLERVFLAWHRKAQAYPWGAFLLYGYAPVATKKVGKREKIVKDERSSFFPLSISDEEKKSFATNGPTRRQQNGGKSFFYLMVKMFQNFLSLSPKVLKVEK